MLNGLKVFQIYMLKKIFQYSNTACVLCFIKNSHAEYGMLRYAFDLRTWEVDDLLGLRAAVGVHTEFQDSHGCIERPPFKQKLKTF